MARQSKIEQFGCEEIVANGLRMDKSVRDIALDCSEWAGEKISHSAVQRYIDVLNEKKKDIVVGDERTLVNVVHQDFDIIQTTIKMASRLLARFDFIDDLPEYFEERMQELEHQVRDKGDDPEYLSSWAGLVTHELKRKVYELTAVSKETREHMKLMADLKERVYQFELMGEFMNLFMAAYQRHSPEFAELAAQEVAGNPRMARIVEQLRLYSDMKGGS